MEYIVLGIFIGAALTILIVLVCVALVKISRMERNLNRVTNSATDLERAARELLNATSSLAKKVEDIRTTVNNIDHDIDHIVGWANGVINERNYHSRGTAPMANMYRVK